MKHVILGGGAAGITAAKTIRERKPEDDILVISLDEQVHSRCMLHHYIGGQRDEEGICFVEEDFFNNNKIIYMNRCLVKSVNPREKTVQFGDQGMVYYDRLLIATGAESFIPPVGALKKADNVYGLRHLSDAKAIRKQASMSQKVIVIGSGLVGLDAAYGLMELGKQVTVVEMASSILPIQLDSTAAKEYQRLFEAAGCNFCLERKAIDTVTNEAEEVIALILDDSTRLECDMVIVAAGVRPATELAETIGLKLDRGIAVNELMQTSCADIYAAGDVTGLSGIWPNAMKQGKIAAQNMCDGNFAYVDRFALKNTIHFFGLPTLCVGAIQTMEGDTVQIEECSTSYKRAILRNGKLVGILLQGDISHSGIYQYLIKNEIDLTGQKKSVFRLNFTQFYGIMDRGEYNWNL